MPFMMQVDGRFSFTYCLVGAGLKGELWTQVWV
jgi:hypothetical protein